MQEDLRAHLVAAGLPRVAWAQRPQGSSLPAVLLTLVSEVTRYGYGGPDALTTSRVQADIYADSYAAALAVDRTLVPAVNGFKGTVGTTEFGAVFLESRFDGTEDPASGSGPLHRISRDLMVSHKET